MAEISFAIGARASATDAVCGQVIRVVVNPIGRIITHLVIGPRHEHGHHIDRLVSVDLVQVTADGIQLDCTKAEFDTFDPAEETHFVAGSGHRGYEPDRVWCVPGSGLSGIWTEGQAWDRGLSGVWTAGQGWDRGGSHGPRRRTVSCDSVPVGEVQVRRGEHVHARDGEIGRVEGLVIDPDNHHVTRVLLREGHLWRRKQVAVPISAVTGVDAEIRLNLSRQQVEDLPPVAIDHPALIL